MMSLIQMIEQQKQSSDIKRTPSFKHSDSHKLHNVLKRLPLEEFSEAWNKEIACRTSCEYYQYRLQYIDYLKTLFIQNFEETIKKSVCLKENGKEGYTFVNHNRNKHDHHGPIGIDIQIVSDTFCFRLADNNPRTIFDKLIKSKSCCMIFTNLSLNTLRQQQTSILNTLSSNLHDLLLYFVVESLRIQPSIIKQTEQSAILTQQVAYNQMQKIKDTHIMRLELNLIDQSQNTEDSLKRLIECSTFCKQFNMVRVYNKQKVGIKYIYKQSIKKPKVKDYLTFQDRNYSLEGFRKHICYLIPFWFTLELKLDQQPHCQIVLVPPLFSQQKKKKLAQKIKNYIINLSQATNTKVLLTIMEKTHNCPLDPYELFISSKLKRSPINIRVNQINNIIFKVPFLNVSAYPLYQRFADGNGLENIKKSDLWKPHKVTNLEDTYVIKFKNQIFIVSFRQDMPYKQKKNVTEKVKMRKLLIYQVYGLDVGISKQDFDTQFRGRIRQTQLQPLLTKISQHLINAPQVLNWSQLSFLQSGKKHSFKVTLPYMSCYGLYLSYLKQKLNYIHRKTSKRRHSFGNRKMSNIQLSLQKLTDTVRFSSFVDDCNLQQYEYSINQQDDMLFLFNYATPRGNSTEPFGNCIYLLAMSIHYKGEKLQQFSQYVYKQVIPSYSKKKSFYIYGVDPKQRLDNKFDKQIKQLISSLNEIFQEKDGGGIHNRDSDAISSSSSFSGSENMFEEQDGIPTQRKYQSLQIQFNFQIIGNQNIAKIQQYCQTQAQGTYCDYLIQGILYRLKRIIDDFILDLPLMSKKKKKISFQDLQCVIEYSLNHLLPLDRMPCMKRSLTIFNYKTPNMDTYQCAHFHTILIELTKNIIQIINTFTGMIAKKVQMIYYVLNSHKKLLCYGSFTKLISKGAHDYNMFLKSLNNDVEVGILFGSHLSDLFDKIDQDNKKSSWTHSIKQYPDGRFFNSQTLVFKRNFLIKLAVTREGVKYFSYNVNRNINYSIVKNIQSLVNWNAQRKYLLIALRTLKQGQKISFPKRQQFQSSLFISQVWDPYSQILSQKMFEKKKKPKVISLTELFKLLVFNILPPTQNSECITVQTNEINRIYQLLMNQKIDFQKFGQLPKSIDYKCDLSRLGFQVLSILRYMFTKEMRKKQEEEDN